MKRISYFDVAWDRRNLRGSLRLTFDDRSQADLRGLSMSELDLVCSLLRAEKPVQFDPDRELFSTAADYPSEP